MKPSKIFAFVIPLEDFIGKFTGHIIQQSHIGYIIHDKIALRHCSRCTNCLSSAVEQAITGTGTANQCNRSVHYHPSQQREDKPSHVQFYRSPSCRQRSHNQHKWYITTHCNDARKAVSSKTTESQCATNVLSQR